LPEESEQQLPESLRVLVVDDSASDTKLVLRELARSWRAVHHVRVESATAMRVALANEGWDVIVCDWSMPQFSAQAALKVVKELELDLPFIIVSGTVGEEIAVDAMRAGAHDFVLKDRLSRLRPAVEREIRDHFRREAHRKSETRLLQSEEALRQSEAQLRQAQKMEALGELAGGVAHDFNNVLSVILTYGELVLSSLDASDPNREDVEEIRRAGQRAADMTRQLLMFSRREVVEPRVVDLNDLLDSMNKMLSRLLREDVSLVIVKEPNLWKTLVDPTGVDQVIMNLIVNARHAMPDGGKVTLETGNATLDGRYVASHFGASVGDHVVLTVTDTGTGMDSATMARIFEPFFTTKEKGQGTGLGLSTVYGIVKNAGGSVWVDSKPGLGSAFRIYLPRVEGQVVPKIHSRRPGSRGGSETVLLVEDEEQVRVMLENVLRRKGYEVLVATDGLDALKVSESHAGTIDLLLTDVVMPGLSGPEAAQRLAARRPQMKTLYVSGYTDASVVRLGAARGEVAFLRKPITPSMLTGRIREILDAPDVKAMLDAKRAPGGHSPSE
jgi:signal transduction histidine kinase